MKTIKFILATVMMMVAFTVQAQTVQVYKDGAVVKEYLASEVKDVQVKQVYYYYAGWECPTNEEELARLAVAPNGGIVDMTKTYTKDNPLRLFSGDVTSSTVGQFIIVIPNSLHIYDGEGESTIEDNFSVIESNIPNHKIFKSQANVKRINGVMLR